MSLISQRLFFTWPFGTFASNVLGCFVIGFISAVSERGGMLSPEIRLATATGFCGGFTTLSSMMYETAGLVRDGEMAVAVLYCAGTLMASAAAFVAGALSVRLLFRLGSGIWN
jgi:CrcB protein